MAALVAVLTVPAAADAACTTHYSRGQYHAAAHKAFKAPPYSAKEKAQLRKFVRCQRSAKSRANVRMHHKRYRAGYYRRFPDVLVRGRVSWFGGPSDGMDSGRTALGLSTSVPGVAIRPGAHYNSGQPFLGGWWSVKIGRRTVVLRQTDIGPNQSTGRRIDVTYSAVPMFGLSTCCFPTDSIGTARWLGHRKP